MRYQRLIIESGSNAVTVRFHPRLTVVSGVGSLERESLVGELFGALDGSRRNIHMEIVDDTDRRLAFLRGKGIAPDRVLDVAINRDVTKEFTDADQEVNLARFLGLSLDDLRRKTIVDAHVMAVMGQANSAMNAVAAVDQRELWSRADRFEKTYRRLETESERTGTSSIDAKMLEEVERRHREFEGALRNHEFARHYAIFVGGSCTVASVPAALMTKVAGLAFLGVAALTTLISIRMRRRMEKARAAEMQSLATAGASSYLGFHMQRMAELMHNEQSREKITDAAMEHREASEAWHQLAGDMPVDWVREHEADIRAIATRLSKLDKKSFDLATESLALSVKPAELAQSLIQRISDLRQLGSNGESLPLILDEPLLGVDTATKLWVLDLLARSAGSLQIIYMTEDPEVMHWARLHQTKGDSYIIEPAPRHAVPARHLTVVA